MNNLATQLNENFKDSAILDLFSEYGKRIYVPKGIIVQASQAKKKASKYNATIGITTTHSKPMYIESIKDQFSNNFLSNELFSYSPMGGNAELREIWKKEMIKKNPSMKNCLTSNPIVTSGLTNGLSIASSLFLNKDDSIVIPNMYWENYNLIFKERCEARLVEYPLFNQNKFNCKGLADTIKSVKSKKVFVMLNFPNNPTGYSPTEKEAEEICEVLTNLANNGKKIIVFVDDAYFGLFFTEDVYRQSLFAKLCNASENLLAIKGDAATKEEMVWGFRIAFLTYGMKNMSPQQYEALEQKTMACIRGSISSCSTPSQNALIKGMKSSSYQESKENGIKTIQKRFLLVKEALSNYSDRKDLIPLPFNSGYFMALKCTCKAEELRLLLLEKFNTGIIRTDEHIIRLAFSSIDEENIKGLIDTVYEAASMLK